LRKRRWAPIKKLAICRRCKGQCCYVKSMSVLLDYEKAHRTLHRYRYELKDMGGHAWAMAEPVLKKRKDGSCVYYDREKRRCSIYGRRPWACKAFFCGRDRKGRGENGWQDKDHVWKLLLQREKEQCDQSSP